MLIAVRIRPLVALAALLALATALGIVLTSSPARADETCQPPKAYIEVGAGIYSCTLPGGGGSGGDDGGGGGGGSSEPACDLSYNEGAYLGLNPDNSGNYCVGTKTCFNVAHFTPWELPDGDPPKKDSKARIEFCFTSPTTSQMVRIYWTDDAEPPSLLEQSRTAIGQIRVPAPTVNLSPDTRTLVNLDTWFWLGGLPQQATGSSAFGLVAIAYDPKITVDPGDGTGTFACPYVDDAASAQKSCTHAYRKASVRGGATVGGRPAYGITVRVVYQLRFEVNGAPMDIPGAQATLEGPPGQTAVRVDEVQTVTRPNR